MKNYREFVCRLVILFIGLTIAHLGVTLFLLSDLGADPFNVLIQGLRQVIENGGVTKPAKKKAAKRFSLTPEQLGAFRPSQNAVSLSVIAREITALAGDDDMQKLSYYDIMDWLVSRGFINESFGQDGKPLRLPSEEGAKIGIRLERRQTPYGDRDYVVYDASAQKLIADNIFAVIEMKYAGEE